MVTRLTGVAMTFGAAFLLVSAAFAQPPAMHEDDHGMAPNVPERYAEPIELFKIGLGPFSRKISSTNKEAQAFFDQGMQMEFAFDKVDAVRSFRESWKRDADCAICYWGEAWAWGSYLNAPMSAEESPHAYAAVQKAMSLRDKHATPVERALIEAISKRYVAEFDPQKRVEQDRAYADAMKAVADKYANDLDVVTFYADALFLLEPRRGTRDVNEPNVQRLHKVLEGILAKDIKHPGACHLYVHATESTVVPEKAAACAEFLGDSIPGASHINHMPSHTWNELGRWPQAIRDNVKAWHSDQKAAVGEGFAIYPEHNLHMLLFAASEDGQGAVATQAGKDYAKLTGDTIYQVLTLVRFGRFDEIAAVTKRPEAPVSGGMWDFAQGYANLRLGQMDFARVYLARVLKTAETSKSTFRFHDARHLLGTVGGILEGEVLRKENDLNGAIAAFERAVKLEDELMYDEPEPLPFAARHWLGAALLEAKRYADAERVYREEIADHPHNGWSLFGLQQALTAQGKKDAAVDKDFEESWARSDAWIRASRY